MRTRYVVGLIALVALGSVAPAVTAGSFSFTTLTPPGMTDSRASGINNAGTVVLSGSSGPGTFQSFLYSGGVYTPVPDLPGATPNSTVALAINDVGQYVGQFRDPTSSFTRSGFFFMGGSNFVSLNPPGGSFFSLASGVNNHGQAVGFTFDSNFDNVGFSYLNGKFTPVADPNAGSGGGLGTQAIGVNDAGTIVGSYFDANAGIHGFVQQNGNYTTLDAPGAGTGPLLGTSPNAINNEGEIVGNYFDDNGVSHGFILQNGVFTTLDHPLGADGTVLAGVNDEGQIVGSYTDDAGNTFAFLATPTVPEPGSLTLAAVTGLAVAGWRLRKRS